MCFVHKPCWKRVLKIRMYLRTPLGPRAMWLEWGPDNIRGLATKNGHFLMFFIRKEVIILQTRTRISTLSFDEIVPVWRKYYAWQENARALFSTFFLHLYGERERLVKTLEEFRKGIIHKWCPTIFALLLTLTIGTLCCVNFGRFLPYFWC